MNLRRQLLLVSLLTLVLPWAGCQFIRETESALREGQQDMLAGTARAIADSLSQFPGEFLDAGGFDPPEFLGSANRLARGVPSIACCGTGQSVALGPGSRTISALGLAQG